MGTRGRFLWRQLHLWLGLSLGALFVLLGLTGSVLAFYPEIDAALHPEIRPEIRVMAQQGHAPDWASPVWDRALATVRAQWPDKDGPWRFEATGKAGAIPARYYNPPERAGRMFAPMMVWLSPDGGEVLRRDYWGDYAMTWIYDLHQQLLAEALGKALVGWSGLAMLMLLASGLIVWWPRGSWRKALAFKRDAMALRRLRDIHKLGGLASFALLFILVATGVLLALPEERDRLMAATIGPVDAIPMAMTMKAGGDVAHSLPPGPQISISQALAVAHRALPDGRLAWIEVPGRDSGLFKIRVQVPGDPSFRFPHSYVHVDQRSGRVLGVYDARRMGAASTINGWLHPLHDASIGGMPTRLLAVVAGLVPLLLFTTGLLHWLRRRRARGNAVGRRAATR